MNKDNWKKNKDRLNSGFIFTILSKLYSGYRPAQIATH
jgi:hypothetical protein